MSVIQPTKVKPTKSINDNHNSGCKMDFNSVRSKFPKAFQVGGHNNNFPTAVRYALEGTKVTYQQRLNSTTPPPEKVREKIEAMLSIYKGKTQAQLRRKA